MNQNLSSRQLAGIVVVLLLAVGLLTYRYFFAPIPSNNASPEDRALHGVTVSKLRIDLDDLAPPHQKAPSWEYRTDPEGWTARWNAIYGVTIFFNNLHTQFQLPEISDFVLTPQGGNVLTQKVEREISLTAKMIAFLRSSGIPITADQPLYLPEPDENPLEVIISIKSDGVVYDDQPTWGNLMYQVECFRMVFVTTDAKTSVLARVISLPTDYTSPVTVAPETLVAKQEELLGHACEAIVARWKEDNPEPAK